MIIIILSTWNLGIYIYAEKNYMPHSMTSPGAQELYSEPSEGGHGRQPLDESHYSELV